MSNKIQENSKEVSNIMKLLSNENRLSILCYIWKGNKGVTEITEDLKISQSLVSQILNRLKMEGILESNKDGREVFYSIKDKNIFKIVKTLKDIYK